MCAVLFSSNGKSHVKKYLLIFYEKPPHAAFLACVVTSREIGLLRFPKMDHTTRIAVWLLTYVNRNSKSPLHELRFLNHCEKVPSVGSSCSIMTMRRYTPHSSSRDFGWLVFPHLPYSPECAPSDSHLFLLLKQALGGQRFSCNADLEEFVGNFLSNLGTQVIPGGNTKTDPWVG